MKVKDVMLSRSIRYCSPDTKLHNAAKTMKRHHCGALPVVDKEKKVMGIVTDRDICLSLAMEREKPLIKTTVGQIMPSRVYTVKSSDDISMAFRQMRRNQISRLPVVDNKGRLKGIVSLHSLIHQSFSNGQVNLGNIYSIGENLTKTIKAITKHYSSHKTPLEAKIEYLIHPKADIGCDSEEDMYEEIADLYEEY